MVSGNICWHSAASLIDILMLQLQKRNFTLRFVANMILLGTDLTFQFDWKEGHFNYSEPNGTMID